MNCCELLVISELEANPHEDEVLLHEDKLIRPKIQTAIQIIFFILFNLRFKGTYFL